MELIDLIFLFSFFFWVILGYGIYRKFYTSIEEILSTTEIKKSRAMQYRAEHLVSSLKNGIFFSIILSIAVNFIALLLFSWLNSYLTGAVTVPSFSYTFFIYLALFTIIIYPLGELHYLCEKENEAETPHHRVLRKIIRKLVEKVKGKTEAVLVFAIIFYIIPFMILAFGLNLDIFYALLIVFMIYPLLTAAYFIAFGTFKLFTPLIFLHNAKNIRLYIGIGYVGIFILFEIALFLKDSLLIGIALFSLIPILIYSLIKDLKYRPYELAHIIDEMARTFEWIHGSFVLLGFGLISFLVLDRFSTILGTLNIIYLYSFTDYFLIIFSILIPLFLLVIILSKSSRYSRALVVTLTKDSMKLNASIKSKFIHDKTLIETIEKSINQNYIRPEYTPKLYRLLNNDDTHIRRKAIVLLRKITEDDRFKSVSTVPYLLDFLKKDKIWTVRLEAAESLTNMMHILPKIEVKSIFEFLSKLPKDKNRYVRWGIIKLVNSIALAREDTVEEVMKLLIKALEDDEWSVRKGTIESFSELLEKFPTFTTEILGKSLGLLADEDLDIVKEVFNLIQKVTGLEVKRENFAQLEAIITEKIGSEYTFTLESLEKAIERIEEQEKPKKFVFKHSELPKG
ncbi:MAG: sister chromatid cohesion protein PDS5 [Candidatus Helarchaeota archaeon]